MSTFKYMGHTLEQSLSPYSGIGSSVGVMDVL